MSQEVSAQAAQLHRAIGLLVKQYQCRDRNDVCCYGISVSQCYALEALGEHGTLTMQALAAHLHLAVSTVTRILAPLVEKGFVERHTTPRDRRLCCVSLSTAGARLYQTIQADLVAREQAVLQRIPARARDHVVWAITELSRAMAALPTTDDPAHPTCISMKEE
ncbi:MAG: MarR family transcriptional regulator [Candidatus Tectomicrobia bacterium]|uniref:MarR family transcriptional regulator n=1 Tax=Tectimicrobiota bacterium TaxID=2528274 RepID=A0A938B1H6_UNCTE|nr:MarR family transcriptional regulator [Candidatus Tectomicrobia bacterium]